MLPLFIIVVLTLFSTLTDAAQLHRFHTGECPILAPMANFDMEQFLGKWFVLQSANDNVYICLREEFNSTMQTVPVTNDLINELSMDDDVPEKTEKTEKVYLVKRSYLLFGGRQFMDETGKFKFISLKIHLNLELVWYSKSVNQNAKQMSRKKFSY